MEFRKILKFLEREGYPNTKTDNVFAALGYNAEKFLIDLTNELGYNEAEQFIKKTLGKLSKQGQNYYSFKIPLKKYENSWVELNITDFYIDEEESETDIIVYYFWGDSRIVHPETGISYTLGEIRDDEESMGNQSEWDDFESDIKTDCYNFISERCGFGIWYQ